MSFKESKNYVAIIALIAGIAGVAYLLLRQNPVNQSNSLSEPIVEEGGETFHPVSLPALSQKTFDGSEFTVGQVLAQNESYTRCYITYKSSGLKISGIMNVPKGSGPFPVLILNHGYIDQAVYTNGRGLRREQDYLARRGYVVVHTDYRNHAESDKDSDNDLKFRLGYVEDAVNAVYAIRKASLPYVDGEKVGMLGHSMGGGVTINTLIVQPNLVDAAVLFAPVSVDVYDNFQRWITRRPELAGKILEVYGSSDVNPDFWHDVSAINFLDRIQAPILLHHGRADESVPIEWSDKLAVALHDLAKQVIYRKYDGQPHEFTTSWGLVMQETAEFFDQHLK